MTDHVNRETSGVGVSAAAAGRGVDHGEQSAKLPKVGTDTSSRIPGLAAWAETIGGLAGQVVDLTLSAEDKCH